MVPLGCHLGIAGVLVVPVVWQDIDISVLLYDWRHRTKVEI